MIGLIRNWLDREWERNGYNPLWAWKLRMFELLPFFAISGAGIVVGAESGDLLYDWGIPLGLALSFITICWSWLRWLKGYSRSEWHLEQIAKREHRE